MSRYKTAKERRRRRKAVKRADRKKRGKARAE